MNIAVGKQNVLTAEGFEVPDLSGIVLFSFKGIVFASLTGFAPLKLKLLNSSPDRYENTCSVLSYTSFSEEHASSDDWDSAVFSSGIILTYMQK